MDDADRAQIEIERWQEMIRRPRLPRAPEPTGECLWCGEAVQPGRRWCDADCRDEWERDHARAHRG